MHKQISFDIENLAKQSDDEKDTEMCNEQYQAPCK